MGKWLRFRLQAPNDKGLRSSQDLENLARPAGFEPTTPWFVARYSIKLIYGREAAILSRASMFRRLVRLRAMHRPFRMFGRTVKRVEPQRLRARRVDHVVL